MRVIEHLKADHKLIQGGGIDPKAEVISLAFSLRGTGKDVPLCLVKLDREASLVTAYVYPLKMGLNSGYNLDFTPFKSFSFPLRDWSDFLLYQGKGLVPLPRVFAPNDTILPALCSLLLRSGQMSEEELARVDNHLKAGLLRPGTCIPPLTLVQGLKKYRLVGALNYFNYHRRSCLSPLKEEDYQLLGDCKGLGQIVGALKQKGELALCDTAQGLDKFEDFRLSDYEAVPVQAPHVNLAPAENYYSYIISLLDKDLCKNRQSHERELDLSALR